MPVPARPGAWAFATLFAVESVSRASIATVVPIQAYDLLKSEQAVSVLYFCVGIFGLTATLCAPVIYRRIPRRFVYTAGALLLIAACACFATNTLSGQAFGLFLRTFASSSLAITLSVYIMDFIPKHELVRSESLRLSLSTVAWTIGPSVGVWLYVEFGHVAPFLWSGAWAVIVLALFWWMRLSGTRAVAPGALRPVNPIANIRRYVIQPRLRLAWLIAFGRSCYWTTFYIYGPILMVATGQGKEAGGLIVSLGNALLLFAVVWGRIGSRIGIRPVVVTSFAGAAATSILAGIAGESHPWTAAILLLAGVNFAVGLDAVGNVPFLRAVHTYERPQMTAVHRTNLDLSELIPAFVYSIILGFFGLGAVFMTLGIFSAICAVVAWRHLPRSM